MISNNTLVLTSKGLLPAIDIDVGDKLVAIDGTCVIVTGVSGQLLCTKGLLYTNGDSLLCHELTRFPVVKSIRDTYKPCDLNTISNNLGTLFVPPHEPVRDGVFRRVKKLAPDAAYTLGYRQYMLPDKYETLEIMIKKRIIAGMIESPRTSQKNDKFVTIFDKYDNIKCELYKSLLQSLNCSARIVANGVLLELTYTICDGIGSLPMQTTTDIQYFPPYPSDIYANISDVKGSFGRIIKTNRDLPVLVTTGFLPVYLS